MKDNGNFPFLAKQTGTFSSLWHHGKHSLCKYNKLTNLESTRALSVPTSGSRDWESDEMSIVPGSQEEKLLHADEKYV
jgi:hypothetical protein